MSQGKADSGTVTCTPLAGRIEWGSAPSSRARTSSAQTPAALTTTDARTSKGVAAVGYDPGAGDPPVGGVGECVDPGVVGRHRTVVEDGGAQDAEREAGVVGPGVPVEESGHQMVGPQGGEVGEGLLLGHPFVAAADAHAAGQVVEPEGRPVGAGHAAVDHPGPAEEGDEEGDGVRPGAGRSR